jgi:antitoxin HicB
MSKRQKSLEKLRCNSKNIRPDELDAVLRDYGFATKIRSRMVNKTIEDYLNLPYRLVITPDDEGGYGVEVVELPGCVTYAERWEAIPLMVQEAMTAWIGSALKHGEPVPESSAVTE